MLARVTKISLTAASLSLLAAAIASTVGSLSAARAVADDKAPAADAAERFFEMRTYIAHEGKFDDLHKRFRNHTNRLFQKHGMQLVGYWTPVADAKGELTPEAARTLVYILAYPSREAREASWKGFMADPEWQAVYKESHKDGPLVAKVISQYLKPTDYSPIK